MQECAQNGMLDEQLQQALEQGQLREDWLIDPECKVVQDPDHFRINSDTAALARFAKVSCGDRVLEIGTNNGAILLYLDRFDPAFLCGAEILPEAARLAAFNLSRQARSPWRIDALPIAQCPLEEYDVVVCNPPYFVPENNRHCAVSDTMRQKARFETNLSLEQMVKEAARRLRSNGRLCFVHRPDRLVDAIECLKKYNLALSRLQIAYDRRDGQAKAILIEAIREGSCQPVILPALWYGQ